MSYETKAYATKVAKGPLEPFTVTRRAVAPDDVKIDIKFAGICHSDIHQARGEWGGEQFPMVPGHEIGGVVVEVGSSVTKFKVGDHVGVGCMVDSCRECSNCQIGDENYCFTAPVFTYNGKYSYKHCAEYNEEGGATTYGGYSQSIVVTERFVAKIPSNLDLAAATPLLCAGITVYSPMKHFGLKAGQKFGVVGLGGLGHMATKFGVAMGAETTVISRGTAKKSDAIDTLKAHHYIDSTNADQMKGAAFSFDILISTISAGFDINQFVGLLRQNGTLILVGAPPEALPLATFPMLFGRKRIVGSIIGGMKETEEMLEFCSEHNIVCQIEKIGASDINTAYDRVMKSDVKYRFVIDCSTI
jgi:uncharacterized zinc-type alcohol dehydrogenase-like protein